MTANDFRQLALALPESAESAHMDHPDFRVKNKIFATLGHPAKGWGMVKLTPEQQRSFLSKAPEVFHPCNGTWGRRGATNVRLAAATVSVVRAALDAAMQNVLAKRKGTDESSQRTRNRSR